jgi:hypothetical protein
VEIIDRLHLGRESERGYLMRFAAQYVVDFRQESLNTGVGSVVVGVENVETLVPKIAWSIQEQEPCRKGADEAGEDVHAGPLRVRTVVGPLLDAPGEKKPVVEVGVVPDLVGIAYDRRKDLWRQPPIAPPFRVVLPQHVEKMLLRPHHILDPLSDGCDRNMMSNLS